MKTVMPSFPLLRVEVSEIIVNSNILEFVAAARQHAQSINLKPETDEDFAAATDDIKDCEHREVLIKEKRQEFISKTGVIAEILDAFNESERLVSSARKSLEKAVKDRRESIKRDAISIASKKITDALLEAEKTIRPIQIDLVFASLDSVVKGKRTIETMRKAIDQHVSECIDEINARTKYINGHLDYLRANAAGLSHLFPDLQRVVNRDTEVFKETVLSRIEQHNQSIELQKQKEDAEKAAKIIEEQHKPESYPGTAPELEHSPEPTPGPETAPKLEPDPEPAPVISHDGSNDPSDDDIIEVIMQAFELSRLSAIELLLGVDLERLSSELLESY